MVGDQGRLRVRTTGSAPTAGKDGGAEGPRRPVPARSRAGGAARGRDCACATSGRLGGDSEPRMRDPTHPRPPCLRVQARGCAQRCAVEGPPGGAGLLRKEGGSLCVLCFDFSLFILKELDPRNVANLLTKRSLVPITQLPSTPNLTRLHYQNQEIDIGTMQLTRPVQLTRTALILI